MSAFEAFFAWPSGGVWANILASALWFIPGYLWGRYHVHKIHGKVSQIHDHLNPKKKYKIGD